MSRYVRAVVASLLLSLPALAAGPKAESPTPSAPVNVTGTWQTSGVSYPFHLFQEGNAVTGRAAYGGKVFKGFVRGNWDGGRLVLVYSQIEDDMSCNYRLVFVVRSGGGVSPLSGKSFAFKEGKIDATALERTTPDPGDDFPYPFDKELRQCGDLLAFDLVFDVGSDVLKNPDTPLLKGLADLLKSDAAVKVRVVGHTDNKGDPEKNRELAKRRAEALKRALVKLGARDEQVAVRSMGQDQPLVSNDTEEGRLVNRRVEILLQR